MFCLFNEAVFYPLPVINGGVWCTYGFQLLRTIGYSFSAVAPLAVTYSVKDSLRNNQTKISYKAQNRTSVQVNYVLPASITLPCGKCDAYFIEDIRKGQCLKLLGKLF